MKASDEAREFKSTNLNISSKESSNQLSIEHQSTHTDSKVKKVVLTESLSSLISESKNFKDILSFEMSTQVRLII